MSPHGTTAAQATASPMPVNLFGQSFRFTPLRHKDFAELEAWVQGRIFEIVRRMASTLTGDDRENAIAAGIRLVSGVTLQSPEASRHLSGIDGAAYLFWLSTRKEHSSMTLDVIREMLVDQMGNLNDARVRELMDEFNRVNDVGKKAGAATPSGTGAESTAPSETDSTGPIPTVLQI